MLILFFPHEFIEQIKKVTDMVRLANEYTELKKGGNGIWIGKCPHPNHHDSTPSFRVWEKDQSWACMACHYGKKGIEGNHGSDCIAFIQWIENISWTEAIIKLAKKANLELPKEEHEELYRHNNLLTTAFQKSLNDKSFKYLINRGLNNDSIKKWRLGFDGEKIVFPLIDRYNRILGFNKRWLELAKNCHDKYKNSRNSEIFNKSCYFYGLHNIDIKFNEIRITEGPMDVILSSQYNVKNVVATLGTSFTEQHALIIKNLKLQPVFIYDGDDKGQQAIKRAVNILSTYQIYAKVFIIPSKKDLADFTLINKHNTEKIIKKNTILYGQYKVSNILSYYNSKVLEAKIEILPELNNVLKEISNPIEKKIIKDSIQNELHINL